MSESNATGSSRSATFTHRPTQGGNGSLPPPPVHCRNTSCTSSRPSGEPMVTNKGTWNCAGSRRRRHVVGDHRSLAVADDDERPAARSQALHQAVLHRLATLLDEEEIVDVAQEGLREASRDQAAEKIGEGEDLLVHVLGRDLPLGYGVSRLHLALRCAAEMPAARDCSSAARSRSRRRDCPTPWARASRLAPSSISDAMRSPLAHVWSSGVG